MSKKKKKFKTKKISLGDKILYNPRVISILDMLRPTDGKVGQYGFFKTGGYIKCPTKKKKKKPRGVGVALKGYGKALS